jgi:arsenite-transporting ATPase
LIITVGSYRRVLPLPAALARGVVAGARLDDGRLQVRFAPRESSRPVASDLPSGTGPLESAQELAQGLTAEYHAKRLDREAAIGEGR